MLLELSERVDVDRLVAAPSDVEVLPQEEYDEEHLEGAIHLPLKQLSAESAQVLDRGRPVDVYCWDGLCDMSPRAGWRLERLGLGPVYDYVAGKLD